MTGQDGSYLTELLINKGYKVYGIKRRSSLFNTKRIDYLYQDPHNVGANLIFYYGDLTDSSNLIRIIQEVQPDEIYNLAAQSHVKVAFGVPEYTANVNALGVLRLLEAIRALGLEKKIRFLQASSSELYGDTNETPQNEDTPFRPCSPYSCAKLYAYWCVDGYRKAYNMFACNAISFNHESPRRGETFVTRKITRGAVRIVLGLQEKLYLGNLNSKRDWGHAKDYVRAFFLMLQQDKPDDFVIATGKQYSIRQFCERAFETLGIELEWRGGGIDEKGIVKYKMKDLSWASDLKIGKEIVSIDPCYYRPVDVNNLLGDATKARVKLGWEPTVSFENLVTEMIWSDFDETSKEKNCHVIPSCEENM